MGHILKDYVVGVTNVITLGREVSKQPHIGFSPVVFDGGFRYFSQPTFKGIYLHIGYVDILYFVNDVADLGTCYETAHRVPNISHIKVRNGDVFHGGDARRVAA